MADGYLNFDTRINTSGFANGLKNITAGLGNLKSGLLKIAAVAGTAFSAVKIMAFAKSAVESAAEINAANSQLTQTFGEMQGIAKKAIEDVAESSGIIKTRLNGVATSIYAFAKTSGMDSATALNMMSEALTIAADSAAYYDRSLEETSETLKSFLKGNFENDAALGLSCTETTRNTAANKLYSKSYIELSESQKQLVLLQMVKDANELSGAMGQAARESEGWENVLGNLKEQFRQFLAVIGQPVLNIAVSVVQKMTSALEILTEKARAAVDTMAELFGIESEKSAEISGNIAESTVNQNELTEAVKETEKAQEGSLAGFDKINIINSGKQDENSDISADSPHTPPIIPTVDETPVDNAIDELAEKFRRLLLPIKVAWEDNSPEFTANAEHAVNAVKSLISSIGESIAEVWENGSGEEFVSHIIGIFSNIFSTVGNLSDAMKNAWKENEVGQRIIQDIFNIFNDILQTVEDIAFSTSEWAKNVDFTPLLEAVDSLLKSLEPLTENIGEGLENFYNNVLLPLASWTIEDLIPTFLESLSKAIDGVNSAWKTAEPVVKEKLWNKFLKPIAKFTADTATKAIELLGDAIKKIGESITTEQVEALIDLAGGISALILAAKGYTFLQSLSTALAGLAPAVTGAIEALGASASLSLSTVFAGISAFIAGYSLTTALLDAFGLTEVLEKVGENIYDFFNETLPPIFSDLGSWLGGFFSDIFSADWNGIAEFFADIPEKVNNFFSEIWDGIKEIYEPVKEWFEEHFGDAWISVAGVFGGAVEYFDDIWNSIKNIFSIVGKWFKERFQNAWNNIQSVFDGLGTVFFKNRWNDIKSALSEVGDWFKEKFQAAFDNITWIFSDFSGFFSDKWDKIKSVYSETRDFFKEKFQSAWDSITEIFTNPAEFFNKVWDGIKGCFSHVSGWFRDTFSEAWEKVKNVFSSGGEIFNGITDGIFETFKSVVNSLIDGINWVISEPFNAINWALDGIRYIEIMDWYPFEWLPNISIPKIPKLAQGTVVPANYGEFMAILGDNKHETEVVSPISTIEKAVLNTMQKSGGNFPKEIVINTYLYPNSTYFHREVVKIVDDDKRRRGG